MAWCWCHKCWAVVLLTLIFRPCVAQLGLAWNSTVWENRTMVEEGEAQDGEDQAGALDDTRRLLDRTLEGSNCPDARVLLAQHNVYRAQHGVPPVSWSVELAEIGQAYADTCPGLVHSNNGLGENIAGLHPPNACVYAIKRFYAECPKYQQGVFSLDVLHWTALVWRATTQMGCGLNYCQGRAPFGVVVCNYFPRPNVKGSFDVNVDPHPQCLPANT